jgi:hypothetical protein
MSTISSSTTSTTAYKVTADTTGTLVLQTGATPTTAVTIGTDQSVTLAGTLTTSSRGVAKASMPAGSVLQVVSTTKTDTFSTASTTFIDLTGFSVSITPTSATSKILIFVDTNYGPSSTSGIAVFNLVRNSTNISQPSTAPTWSGTAVPFLNGADTCMPMGFNFLDSPATTSSTTYKVQVKVNTGNTLYVNRRLSTDTVSTSTITVMEIAA